MERIQLLIVDDHKVLADGIIALLEQEDDLNIVRHTMDGRETLEFIKEHPTIDVMLLDINLPDKSGVDICKQVRQSHPDMKILALTMHHEPTFISKMIKAGAHGYVLKNTGKDELLKAIYTVYKGESYFSNQVKNYLVAGFQQEAQRSSFGPIQKITRREKEILKLIVEELTTEEIAEKLFISATTVISHRKSLLRKLQAKNTAGLVKAAYEYELLS